MAPVSETLSASRLLSKRNLYQIIKSEGSDERIHLEEGESFKVNKGVTKIAGHIKRCRKKLRNIVKQSIETSERRKSSSLVLYGVTKPTVKAHIRQRMLKWKSK